MKDYYTINEIAQMTGLTTRTLRNYIRQNLLEGEKVDGVWQFSEQQIGSFLANPNVTPALQAKRNAVVYDFLLDKAKKNDQMCVILDLPNDNFPETSGFFTNRINQGCYSNDFRFTADCNNGYSRIILKGQAEDVFELLKRFYDNEEPG